MFSGIVEAIGEVTRVEPVGGGVRLLIRSSIPVAPAGEAGVGQSDRDRIGLGDSIAIFGICLTAEALYPPDTFAVLCGQETIVKSRFGQIRVGDHVHLERALRLTDRLDGHLVQGHVDGLGTVLSMEEVQESWVLWLTIPSPLMRYCAVKGSICIDGISLTVNEIDGNALRVNIIPHTADYTVISKLRSGQYVHIEMDMLARYVERLLMPSPNSLTRERLQELGYSSFRG